MMNSHKTYIIAIVLVILSLVASACGAQTSTPPLPTTAPTESPTQAPPTAAPTTEPTQSAIPELYMPRNVALAFANGTRSSDGNPGPKYWQNKAVHDISITVAPPNRTVSGSEEIIYTNNSPYKFSVLPIRLYMNVHLPEAQRESYRGPDFLTTGVHIDEFSINDVVTPWEPHPSYPFITLKVINLPEPLSAGESIKLSFKWHYDLATEVAHEGAFDPTSFFLAYFFPRVTNANDTDLASPVAAFDAEEFTYRDGRERLDDFADFTVAVTVPKNFVVWATGELQNPDEVLQPTYAQRLTDSMTSDTVTNIATPEDVQQGQVTAQTNTVTWKWKADNVTTFGIGLSDHYIWDAGSVIVDPATGRRASVQAAYPVEAVDYTTMVEDAKRALAFGSTQWPGVPYPYPKTTIFVAGGDEEFPMMANDTPDRPAPESVFPAATVGFVATHELLHSWFPFYMGTDERRYPMMDEGWTTAFEYLAGLEIFSKADVDNLFKGIRSGNLVSSASGMEIPIITPADSTRGNISGRNGYDKPALAYLALKELMGDDAFRVSLHEFIDRWNGKHPLPWDMFNTFNDTSDQDLTWFFNNWFFEPNYLDLAIESVDSGTNGTIVTIDNKGGFAIPFDVIVTYADGTSEAFHQNPGIWKDSPKSVTISIDSPKEVNSVVVDGGIFVDATIADNVWSIPTETSTPPAEQSSTDSNLATLTEQTWMWTGFTDPGQQFNVDHPENYTLHFMEDGTVQIKADCNNGTSNYTVDGSNIQIDAGALTRVACPPESRSDDFIKYLGSAAIYFSKDGNLNIDLLADGGTMTFAPAAN